MNAASKVVAHQGNLFHGAFSDLYISKAFMLQMLLLIALLLSALCVVYVTNLQRLTLDQLQMAEQRTHHLELRWGQLTLEQASLATPSRVEQFATQKLHMMIPANKELIAL